MKKLILIILIFYPFSCTEIEFVYNNDSNLINPLYEKTEVDLTGVDLVFINSYTPLLFGEYVEKKYKLEISVEEKKTNLSVEKNQAVSNLRYELRFFYSLRSIKESCLIYEKQILSYFSIIPKSAGYNYGTDASLEKKYELAIIDNLNQFVSFLSSIDINKCK